MGRRLSAVDKLKLAKLHDDAVATEQTVLNGKAHTTAHFLQRKVTIPHPNFNKDLTDPNHGYPTLEESNPFLLSTYSFCNLSECSWPESAFGCAMRSIIALCLDGLFI